MNTATNEHELKTPTLEAVKSSGISHVGHDAERNILYVRFVKGTAYAFSDFSADEYKAFRAAESLGKYFQEKIRNSPKHKTTRISDVQCETPREEPAA